MQLDIQANHFEISRQLREFAERRLFFGLARFGGRIRRVSITLTDTNGPRGGVGLHCLIRAALSTGGCVNVESIDSAVEPAIHRAVDRLVRRLRDEVQRRRDLRRRPMSTGRLPSLA